MKKEKAILGVRPMKKGEDAKGLGIIKFGKSRPDKTKYVLVDIEYDEKAGKEGGYMFHPEYQERNQIMQQIWSQINNQVRTLVTDKLK